MNELKSISIKLILTIPALVIGTLSYVIFLTKHSQFSKLVFGPIIKLWSNKQELHLETPEIPKENHNFI